MKYKNNWTMNDFADAMNNAVSANAHPKFIKKANNKMLFNGFWRKGDKQNVCLWLDKATWSDAKTGDGGGCKEFAKAAFNMNLREFMERFSISKPCSETIDVAKAFAGMPQSRKVHSSKPVQQIFRELSQMDKNRDDKTKIWLETKRGFINPRFYICSGFANLLKEDIGLFESQHQNFVLHRLAIAEQMVVPLRGIHSDEVQNLFFRSLTECPREEKSRLLPNVGGWHEQDGSPRAFGFPHLAHEFPNLLLCEGMGDYFATECLLDCEHNYLPIGAGTASALPKWAEWLVDSQYRGHVIIIFHIDQDKHGNLSDSGIGQENAIKCLNRLGESGIKSTLFPWLRFMNRLNNLTQIRDLADSLTIGFDIDKIQNIFLEVIQGGDNAN
jgi:hypothetical protein